MNGITVQCLPAIDTNFAGSKSWKGLCQQGFSFLVVDRNGRPFPRSTEINSLLQPLPLHLRFYPSPLPLLTAGVCPSHPFEWMPATLSRTNSNRACHKKKRQKYILIKTKNYIEIPFHVNLLQ